MAMNALFELIYSYRVLCLAFIHLRCKYLAGANRPLGKVDALRLAMPSEEPDRIRL